MPKRVNVPGMGVVNFPDTMSEAAISAAISKMPGMARPSGPPPDTAIEEFGQSVLNRVRNPGEFSLSKLVPPEDKSSVFEKALGMVRGEAGSPWGEGARFVESKVRSWLPGGGTSAEERSKIATGEGLPDPNLYGDKYTREADLRSLENAGYSALNVHAPMNVGKPGFTSAVSLGGPRIFGKAADALEKSSARHILKSLDAPESDIASLRGQLGTPHGDVGVEAGRVLRDLNVPSTGEPIITSHSTAPTRLERTGRALDELHRMTSQTVEEASHRNPLSVKVKDLLDEAAGAAEGVDTRAERAVAGEANIQEAANTIQRLRDEYMRARETAAHVQYPEAPQGEFGATSTTISDPGTPGLRPGTPENLVGESQVARSARAVTPRSPGVENAPRVWTGRMIEDPKTGQMVREMVVNQMSRVGEPPYRQPVAPWGPGERPMTERRVNIIERDTSRAPRVGESGVVSRETGQPVPTDPMEPNWNRNLTAEDRAYPQNIRPNEGSAAEPRVEHAPAVPHPGTPTEATQGSLFPMARDAAGEWAPHTFPDQPPGTGGKPGGPVHVGSDVQYGPNMTPLELHDLIVRLDKEVWKTASERNPNRPQAAIDASPDLQLKQKIAGSAAKRLKEAVRESLGETRGDWFERDMRNFSQTLAAETPIRAAADKAATTKATRPPISAYTMRHFLPIAGFHFGGVPWGIAGGLADIGMWYGSKYGHSAAGRGLMKASEAARSAGLPEYNLKNPAVASKILADRIRQKEEEQ